MIKHCPFCNTRFKAKPSGKKYCCYDHFVYDKYKDKTEAIRVVKRYRERALPSLTLQAQMDIKRFHKGDQQCQN